MVFRDAKTARVRTVWGLGPEGDSAAVAQDFDLAGRAAQVAGSEIGCHTGQVEGIDQVAHFLPGGNV